MASACVNNNMALSPDNFLDCPTPYPPYRWLTPRVSFGCDFSDSGEKSSDVASGKPPPPLVNIDPVDASKDTDPEVSGSDAGDFEFRLDLPVKMLPADELFSDGKLVPLQPPVIQRSATTSEAPFSEIRSLEVRSDRAKENAGSDSYLFSPKAPRCSSRWKELLGLKKLCNNNAKQESGKTTPAVASNGGYAAKSLKNFLHRSSKSLSSSLDSSLSLPLLKDAENESALISSRPSLSSSSSGHEHDDLPRLSLDSDKPASVSHASISLNRNPNRNTGRGRVRAVKTRTLSAENAVAIRTGRSPIRRVPDSSISTVRGLSVDSPRMNSSGKIVFNSLERSSSSPSSFNGGPRFKHRGMERSYSANVRVTPVLNVPVCSIRGSSKSGVFGFPLFSSQQRRDGGSGGAINSGGNKHQIANSSRHRTDRNGNNN